MNLYEHILVVVETLPEKFTVAMVRHALRARGVIVADILLRHYINQLEARGLLTGVKPDGFHVVYSVVREERAS